MGEYSIVSDISAALVRLLREQLCPDPVQSTEAIQLASPTDGNGDYHVGLYLYDLREISEYRRWERVRAADGRITYPARPLSLHYMIYLNGRAQLASGAEAEQRILARSIQAFADHMRLDIAGLHPFPGPTEEEAVISLPNLSFEDKSKVWTALSQPYQLAVHFVVSPVLLSSRHEEDVVRVRSAVFHTLPAERRRRER